MDIPKLHRVGLTILTRRAITEARCSSAFAIGGNLLVALSLKCAPLILQKEPCLISAVVRRSSPTSGWQNGNESSMLLTTKLSRKGGDDSIQVNLRRRLKEQTVTLLYAQSAVAIIGKNRRNRIYTPLQRMIRTLPQPRRPAVVCSANGCL